MRFIVRGSTRAKPGCVCRSATWRIVKPIRLDMVKETDPSKALFPLCTNQEMAVIAKKIIQNDS